ncbi:MAG TPA: alanine--tRNA ligase [Lentimicrobium sp.]|nr:alanine--tRNA ligase [Lentimicrobium sp.]
MNAKDIRQKFLNFFESKQHHIVPSAPMVIKDDPTLMFTNAGMNQFKDIFLGNSPVKYPRIANTQKCLRVSGKHNDLEEVGHDTYHHTMFEMLGNWSFGDYFKKEAIEWAWEFLTKEVKIDVDRIYVTIFGGDEGDNLPADLDAYNFWLRHIDKDRILRGSKKDNFWEMGDSGPCGPCSEIHVDIRDDEQRKKIDGKILVNTGDPLVIEIWNLVFMEFNRLANGSLQPLPAKHVDTGMGFERLCMVLQGKKSNYDTDVFQPIINEISSLSGIKYGTDTSADIAMRVIADHLRAIAFAIADGQLPSNNKAGYVIRRILRRAVRYGYTFLNLDQPFINQLVTVLIREMGGYFTELAHQKDLIIKVILEEESSFLRTLAHGINKFNQYVENNPGKVISGEFAFELYDTFGFPIDLTTLMAREHGLDVNMDEFRKGLEQQKERSRKDATVEAEDWEALTEDPTEVFIGYDTLETDTYITRYRKISQKGKTFYQIALAETPFYAESGGQSGDTGILEAEGRIAEVIDTKKENNLIVHYTTSLPFPPGSRVHAKVSEEKRINTANNHSATHLLHQALRHVLGKHVEQKGSYVHPDYLRFDFAHYQKMSEEEIYSVEVMVNKLIRKNYSREEWRSIPIEEAKQKGALALFGEKYGEKVRMIKFGESIELCGGTHVPATGQIGLFKIISESAIAAGVRRIEAVTGNKALEFYHEQNELLNELKTLVKNSNDPLKAVKNLMDENNELKVQIEKATAEKVQNIAQQLSEQYKQFEGFRLITAKVNLEPNAIRDLTFKLMNGNNDLIVVIGSEFENKPLLTASIADSLVKTKGYNASTIIKEVAKEIKGGGGGQPHYATAGGKDSAGLDKAIEKAAELIASF